MAAKADETSIDPSLTLERGGFYNGAKVGWEVRNAANEYREHPG